MLSEIIEIIKKSIVYIKQGESTGTGFIISQEGNLVTCNHVVAGGAAAKVYLTDRELQLDAEVLRRLPERDIAILKIEAPDLIPLVLGQCEDVAEGDEVMFCGFPFAIKTLTTHKGIISAKFTAGQQADSFPTLHPSTNVLQLDATVNMGNSGGPLLKLENQRVVGLVNARFGRIPDEWIQKVGAAKGLIAGVRGGIRVDPFEELQNILVTMNKTMQLGIGYAVSTEYIT